jgi:AraC family transcriptional regulator
MSTIATVKPLLQSPVDSPWRYIKLQHAEILPFEPIDLSADGEHVIGTVTSDNSALVERAWSSQTEKYYLQRLDTIIAPMGPCGNWRAEHVFQAITVHVNHDLIVELALEAGFPAHFELSFHGPLRDPLLAACLLELRDEVAAGFPAGALYGDSIATAIGAHVLSRYCTITRTLTHRGKFGTRTLATVIEYLKNNLQDDISLAELAALAHMSPHHFLRMFKASTGLTPHQYLINYRISVGKRLLSSHDLTIKQIAKMVGFCDAGHFSRHFKRLAGISPGSYASRAPRAKPGTTAGELDGDGDGNRSREPDGDGNCSRELDGDGNRSRELEGDGYRSRTGR